MTIQTGYAIANLAALKALTNSQRIDGYSRLVKSDAKGLPSWYTFLEASTATPGDDSVILPQDNPTTGRWHKSSGAGGGLSFGGAVMDNSSCDIGGKGFEFYSPQPSLDLIIVPGFNSNIPNELIAISVYRWSQTPNPSHTGREASPVVQLPSIGGKITITIDADHRFISFTALDFEYTQQEPCFVVNGNVITLINFTYD